MAATAVRSSRPGMWPMLILFGILLVSLSLMSDATHNSERFGQLYSWLLLLNTLGLVVLTGLIGANLSWLVSQYRARAPWLDAQPGDGGRHWHNCRRTLQNQWYTFAYIESGLKYTYLSLITIEGQMYAV